MAVKTFPSSNLTLVEIFSWESLRQAALFFWEAPKLPAYRNLPKALWLVGLAPYFPKGEISFDSKEFWRKIWEKLNQGGIEGSTIPPNLEGLLKDWERASQGKRRPDKLSLKLQGYLEIWLHNLYEESLHQALTQNLEESQQKQKESLGQKLDQEISFLPTRQDLPLPERENFRQAFRQSGLGRRLQEKVLEEIFRRPEIRELSPQALEEKISEIALQITQDLNQGQGLGLTPEAIKRLTQVTSQNAATPLYRIFSGEKLARLTQSPQDLRQNFPQVKEIFDQNLEEYLEEVFAPQMAAAPPEQKAALLKARAQIAQKLNSEVLENPLTFEETTTNSRGKIGQILPQIFQEKLSQNPQTAPLTYGVVTSSLVQDPPLFLKTTLLVARQSQRFFYQGPNRPPQVQSGEEAKGETFFPKEIFIPSEEQMEEALVRPEVLPEEAEKIRLLTRFLNSPYHGPPPKPGFLPAQLETFIHLTKLSPGEVLVLKNFLDFLGELPPENFPQTPQAFLQKIEEYLQKSSLSPDQTTKLRSLGWQFSNSFPRPAKTRLRLFFSRLPFWTPLKIRARQILYSWRALLPPPERWFRLGINWFLGRLNRRLGVSFGFYKVNELGFVENVPKFWLRKHFLRFKTRFFQRFNLWGQRFFAGRFGFLLKLGSFGALLFGLQKSWGIFKKGVVALGAQLALTLLALGKAAFLGALAGGLVGGIAGAIIGAKIGAAIGATIGSVIPGVGTVIGGVVGGFIGGTIGFFVGAGVGGAIGAAIGWFFPNLISGAASVATGAASFLASGASSLLTALQGISLAEAATVPVLGAVGITATASIFTTLVVTSAFLGPGEPSALLGAPFTLEKEANPNFIELNAPPEKAEVTYTLLIKNIAGKEVLDVVLIDTFSEPGLESGLNDPLFEKISPGTFKLKAGGLKPGEIIHLQYALSVPNTQEKRIIKNTATLKGIIDGKTREVFSIAAVGVGENPPALIEIGAKNLLEIFKNAASKNCLPLPLILAISRIEAGAAWTYNEDEVQRFSTPGWWNAASSRELQRGYCYDTCAQPQVNCAIICGEPLGYDLSNCRLHRETTVMGVMQFEEVTWEKGYAPQIEPLVGHPPHRCNLIDSIYTAARKIKNNSGTEEGNCSGWNEEIVRATARAYCGSCGNIECGENPSSECLARTSACGYDYCGTIWSLYKEYSP